MFLLLTRIQNLNLPLDLQMKLYDQTVMPILIYGSEILGFENTDSIETVHNDFLRKITRSKRSTPMYMVYAELGRHPISLDVNCRMISFWTKIITGKHQNSHRCCTSICIRMVITILNGYITLDLFCVTLVEVIFG